MLSFGSAGISRLIQEGSIFVLNCHRGACFFQKCDKCNIFLLKVVTYFS